MPQELGHLMARPHHEWRSDGTIWTNGTTRLSSKQKKTICWSHSATPDNQTSQFGLRVDTRRWQEEGWKTKEDMARHTERRFGHIGCWLEWREIYCQRSCQMETTRCPMFCSEREELSLSKSFVYNHEIFLCYDNSHWHRYTLSNVKKQCIFPEFFIILESISTSYARIQNRPTPVSEHCAITTKHCGVCDCFLEKKS